MEMCLKSGVLIRVFKGTCSCPAGQLYLVKDTGVKRLFKAVSAYLEKEKGISVRAKVKQRLSVPLLVKEVKQRIKKQTKEGDRWWSGNTTVESR